MQFFQTLVLSLILHLLIVSILDKLPDRPKPSEIPIEVVYSEAPPPREKARTLVRETEREDQKDVDKKKKARFLSERTKRVEQETRVRNSGLTQNTGGDGGRPQQLQSRPRPKAEDPGLGKIAKRFIPDVNPLKQGKTSRPGRPGPQSTIGEKLPDDVKFGNLNALNTDRYLYYTFFARVEERIRPRWESQVKEVMRQLNPALARQSEWITQIEVLLDRAGRFQQVIVHKKSGLDDLDLAAIEAFKTGSPYQNPPEDMIQADGRIHLYYSISVSAAF